MEASGSARRDQVVAYEQKESLQRDIEKFASMDPAPRDRQQEIWKEELEEIERKRTELLPEHQKMQKRSQKPHRLRDEQRNHLKNARDCEEEMQMLNKEMEERKALYETRFRALSEKFEKQQPSWKMRSRPRRQVKREEVAVRRNPMDVALIQPYGSRSSQVERHRQQVFYPVHA